MNEERKKELFTLYRTRRKELNIKYKHLGKTKYTIMDDYKYYKDLMSKEQFSMIIKSQKNRKAQRNRCNKKFGPINWLREYNPLIVFGTLTFDDSQFYKKNGKEIQERTRTKKVNNWLTNNTLYSIANIDYGEKKEREHHHFIAMIPTTSVLIFTGQYSKKGFPLYTIEGVKWEGGWYTIEIVKYNEKDFKNKRLSDYMLKINNHENKITTKNRRFRVFDNIGLNEYYKHK